MVKYNINSEIRKLRARKNKLISLSKKKKEQELKMIAAINEQRKLKKEIKILENQNKPVNQILKNISCRYKNVNNPENRKRLKKMYMGFKKFANKYGE